MLLSVSTLGCPEWSFGEIVENLPRYGIKYVDFRGVKDDLDITVSDLFTANLDQTKAELANAGIAVSGISSGINLCQPAQFEDNIAEAERTIDLAIKLNTDHIRLFGHGYCPEPLSDEARKSAAELARKCLEKIFALPHADKVRWSIETHDAWQKPEHMNMLLEGFSKEQLGVLWDIENYIVCGGGNAEDFIQAFAGRIFNVHIKDSIPGSEPGKVISVVPGTGDFKETMLEIVKKLHGSGYNGFLTLEYEKRWQRDIPGPEKAFPAYVSWMGSIL